MAGEFAIQEDHTLIRRAAALVAEGDREELRALCRERDRPRAGRTALHAAAALGRVDLVGPLLEAGSDLEARDAGWAEEEVRRRAFASAADDWSTDGIRSGHTLAGYTPLMEAVQNHRADVAEQLVSAGADLNAQDTRGFTPLKIAIEEGYEDLAAWLLERGADPHAADARKEPPLAACARLGRNALFDRLMGLAPPKSALNRALGAAVVAGRSALARRLLAARANPNARIRRISPILIRAIDKRDVELVQDLLDHGANPNVEDPLGWTPLCDAVSVAEPGDEPERREYPELVGALLRAGADPNGRMVGGETPLEMAIAAAHPRSARLLIDAGADLEQRVDWNERKGVSLREYTRLMLELSERRTHEARKWERERARVEHARKLEILRMLEEAGAPE